MMRIPALPLVALLLAPAIKSATGAELEKEFIHPQDSARPWVYWRWISGNASKAGITRDFEEFKRQGIGGALLFDAGKAKTNDVPKGPPFMSSEWRELFEHAVREADRLSIVLTDRIDGAPVDYAEWPVLENPWMRQARGSERLLVEAGGLRATYDFSRWNRLTETSGNSRLVLTSSSDYLADGFAWAKRTALSKVHPDNGGCYQAALPDRGGYCQRDYVHQIDGAALLGLHRENLAMLRCFATNQTKARGWFTLWEINYDGTPMACDYRDDQHFWRNTAGMFDLLHGAYRQYRWTANPALVEDPVLHGFYSRTVNEFVAAHDPDGNGIVEGRSGTGWGIACTYNEMPGIVLAESADSLGTQRRAFEAYARFLQARGDRAGAEAWAAKAGRLQRVFNDTWYDAAAGRYRIGVDHPERRPVTGFGYETSWFIPYTGLCEPGARATAYLDFIRERFQAKPSPNIEAWTYLPDVFYSWNQNECGWQYFKHVLNSRSRYPEVSFTVISHLAIRIMGIEPDAPGRAVTTLGRLPTEVAWAELDHVPVGSNDILVRHEDSNRTTTLVNNAGADMTWEALFAGEHAVILVDDVPKTATAKALNGIAGSSVTLKVKVGQRRVVKVPESSPH